MPRPRLLLLLALPACLLPGLLLAAATAPAPHLGEGGDISQYTIQPGDTLSGIARKHGLTPDALAKANALDQPHRLAVGNVLRLPVTPPQAASPQPVPFQPVPFQPAPAANNAPAKGDASPARPAPPLAAPAVVPTKAPEPAPVPAAAPIRTETPAPPLAPPMPVPTEAPAAKAAAPAKAETPAQAPEPVETAAIPDSPAKLAVGVYTNPVLGSLRLSQTPAGIALTRDNQTIPMRHLLYGIFDGSDSSGGVHGLRLEFDSTGQVSSLMYSSGSARDIPFTRVKK